MVNFDPKKDAMTIQHLLAMTSGFVWTELGFEGTPSSSVTEMVRSSDWRFSSEKAARPLKSDPPTVPDLLPDPGTRKGR
jgi:CubicO group peptidase (beta-lactamase class C family)